MRPKANSRAAMLASTHTHQSMTLSLIRSKVELFLQCPRCFWLAVRANLRQPPDFPFNLNSAVDRILRVSDHPGTGG